MIKLESLILELLTAWDHIVSQQLVIIFRGVPIRRNIHVSVLTFFSVNRKILYKAILAAWRLILKVKLVTLANRMFQWLDSWRNLSHKNFSLKRFNVIISDNFNLLLIFFTVLVRKIKFCFVTHYLQKYEFTKVIHIHHIATSFFGGVFLPSEIKHIFPKFSRFVCHSIILVK